MRCSWSLLRRISLLGLWLLGLSGAFVLIRSPWPTRGERWLPAHEAESVSSATPSPSSLPLPTNLLADGADGADGADLGPNVVESAAASATIPAASNWIFQDPVVDPPGFRAFQRELEEQQRSLRSKKDPQWLIFCFKPHGIGNWMLGLASALLMAWLTGRLFAHMGNPRSCEWFGAKSPLCRWQEDFLPQKLRERVQDFVSNPLSTKVKMRDLEHLKIYWKGCSYRRVCKEMKFKQILVVTSGAWFGELFLDHTLFSQRMQAAFHRTARDKAVIADIYAPLSRWLFSPGSELQQEIENYVGSHLRSESVSVCLQGRWGSRTEFENGKACIDEMMAAPWWPGTLVIHVASMSNNFREKVKATYPGVNVTWPSWDASVRAQKDDSTAYKDMLLTGKCHILVAPNGGSTYTYTPTAMYHSVVVRNKPNCSDLPFLPYWKLFPEPKMQLDIAHQCGKVPHC